ncbi:MAG TPA: HPF/RaiA family ribosome-associated protein [Gemmatimonadales bacterium]|nr:HPF/RaiA family ribosome-associated protein [Gemmatimonadales bacterium]
METTITTRHGEIAEALRLRVERVVERLARLARRPTAAHVTFGQDHQRATAEVRLTAARGMVHVASADAPDHRTALDRAAQKLRRQLDKQEANPRRRAGSARR